MPAGDELVIEARLNPVDRGYVQPGQKAVVKISTYDFVRYGGLEGVVGPRRICAPDERANSLRRPADSRAIRKPQQRHNARVERQ